MAFTPEEEARIKQFIDLVTQSSPGGGGVGQGRPSIGQGNTLLQALRTQADRLARVNSVTQTTSAVLGGLGTSAKNAAVSITEQLGKSITQLADGIMGDTLGFRTAGNFMKNMIGILTTGFSALTDIVGSVGKALGSLPNKFIAGSQFKRTLIPTKGTAKLDSKTAYSPCLTRIFIEHTAMVYI